MTAFSTQHAATLDRIKRLPPSIAAMVDARPSNGIGWAVKQMQMGACVRRIGWNGKGMYLYLHHPDDKDFAPYVVMFTAQKQHQSGWLCSQADLLATDWELAD